MVWTGKRIASAVAAGIATAGLVAGLVLALSGSPKPRPVSLPPSPSPSPSPTHQTLHSPFTGERVTKLRRVIAVKIDNYVAARPQTGLNKADIVYVLPVEGGLSRFMAVFSAHIPKVVGPVRSARQTDLPLLRQFGRPGFAFSGATPRLLPYIHNWARVVNLYSGYVGGYFRVGSRPAPYNEYARARKLFTEARHASEARNIGFRFGPPPPGGHRASARSARFPSASYRFTWSGKRNRWLAWIDGNRARVTGAGQLGAATVVIQHTRIRTSRFLEYGSRPPFAMSTGHGRATVLRNGRAYQAHWSRPNREHGTRFTTMSGKAMTFARGPVWVLLVR